MLSNKLLYSFKLTSDKQREAIFFFQYVENFQMDFCKSISILCCQIYLRSTKTVSQKVRGYYKSSVVSFLSHNVNKSSLLWLKFTYISEKLFQFYVVVLFARGRQCLSPRKCEATAPTLLYHSHPRIVIKAVFYG